MHAAQAYRLECPECGEEIYVDGGMRQSLVDAGCVVCEAPLTMADFTKLSG